MNKPKVFVGLSGGVDSAVSAALLKQKGFDVTGVFIKVWHPDFLPCSWREERRDAMRVAAKLNIPFLFFDFEKDYKDEVADYMINEYKAGRTPNPDILCNRVIKFGSFWKKAKEAGADFIAMGHYAQIAENKQEISSNKYQLKEGQDKNKDQSYFLWMLEQGDLEHVLFPIGNLEKLEVRKLATEYDLPVSEKKDSQGICFIGDVSIEEFLSHYIKVNHGKVLNLQGEVIGTHNGAIFYTIGERHGFDITHKTSSQGPFYVVKKDIENNTITVSDKEEEIQAQAPSQIILEKINWINKPRASELEARIRYRQEKINIKINLSEIGASEMLITLPVKTKGVSLGQSLVFYDGDNCLGGGIIKKLIS